MALTKITKRVSALTFSDVGALAVGATAVNSSKLENKTLAQVVADARSGYVPDTRTVNGLRLNANVTLTHTHVGAAPASHTHAYIPTGEKAAANGVATLGSDGKIPQNQIPAIAISETFTAQNEPEMLKLVAQTGDVCRRGDLRKSFILSKSPASAAANWLELYTPDAAVTSVNSMIGDVVLNHGHVGALAAGGTAVNAAKLDNATKAQIIADARANLVPTSRTVNGLALTGNIALNSGHVGALAAGGTAVNAAKLDNATKAQIIAEARSGLAAAGVSYTKAESDARYVQPSQMFGKFKRLDHVMTAAGTTVAHAPVSNILFVTVGGVMQAADAYTVSGGTITFSESLAATEVVTILGL